MALSANWCATCSVIWTTYLRFRLVSDSKTRYFKQEYRTFTQQLLFDWEYNLKHNNFRLPCSYGRKISGRENSGVDSACGFPVKAFVVRVIGHTWKTDHIVPWQVLINLKQSTYFYLWKTDHIVPWQVLINLKQSTYFCTIFEGRKTKLFCKIGQNTRLL